MKKAAQRLVVRTADDNIAIMCAERLPWQCHRFLIADFLTAHGNRVTHLINEGKTQEHKLNAVARVHERKLVYDGKTQSSFEL